MSLYKKDATLKRNYEKKEGETMRKKQEEIQESQVEIVQEESYEIRNYGNFVKDIQKIDVIKHEIPEIKTQEFHIQQTGNFLGIQGKNINVPIEMIIFPFFTSQKQNRRVNFLYHFDDLGITMKSTLLVENNKDVVFQPSVLEDKLYTFLLFMYERKEEEEEEYIEFEISDFIVEFLGNKMNRTYYTKVEQALKNLKRTTYEFSINNHKKAGNYKFESEMFQLLNYEKTKRGKKVYYRAQLHRNIRNKIKEKRYIIYNSKALIEILNKDHVAYKIYRYISQIRYKNQEGGEVNIKTLAAIIPLKIEQKTERETKQGVKKEYVLNRLKPVLTRIRKAFDVLLDFAYLLDYESSYSAEEDTYYISYRFNPEKDNSCHIASYLKPNKEGSIKKLTQKKSKREVLSEEEHAIREAEIQAKKRKSPKLKNYVETFPERILVAFEKMLENSAIRGLWDKRNERKISKLLKEEEEDLVLKLLDRLTHSYHVNLKSSIATYMNMILRSLRKESKNKNLSLFGEESNTNNAAKSKTQINDRRSTLKKTANATPVIEESTNTKEIVEILGAEKKRKQKIVMQEEDKAQAEEAKLVEESLSPLDTLLKSLELSPEEEKKLEEKALEKYQQKSEGSMESILHLKKKKSRFYDKIMYDFYIQALAEEDDK